MVSSVSGTDDAAEVPATLHCLSVAPPSDVTADDAIELVETGCS